MPKSRRATLPVLIVLLAFLSGAAYLVYRTSEDALAGEREDRAVARSANAASSRHSGGDERGWQHHD